MVELFQGGVRFPHSSSGARGGFLTQNISQSLSLQELSRPPIGIVWPIQPGKRFPFPGEVIEFPGSHRFADAAFDERRWGFRERLWGWHRWTFD